jgi:hypothetical protein
MTNPHSESTDDGPRDVSDVLADAQRWMQARPWMSPVLQAGDIGVWLGGDDDVKTLV